MRKRAVWLFSLLSLCFLLLTVRIIAITAKNYSAASQSGGRKTIELGESRGKIYDRSLEKLVDKKSRLVAVFTPDIGSRKTLEELFGAKRAEEVIKSKRPFSAEVKTEINNEYIRTFKIPVRYASSLACQLVGYTDPQTGEGISGIEKGYNDFLKKSGGKLSVSFEVDAEGRVLQGFDKEIRDENFSSKGGVVLTVDGKIQKITEKMLEKSKIKSGCVVVLHALTGEVLALANKPSFDRNNLDAALKSELSPLVNKALGAYSAGSVFKSVIAAYALESGIPADTKYTCRGKCTVGDTVFTCYNEKAHGEQTMEKALGNSCNTYFVNLIEKLDTDGLLMFCRALGFESEIKLAENVVASKGCLPEQKLLRLPGERANFSFGQGRLSVTPIQLAAAYNAIATGCYIEPTVIFGLANEDGLVKKAPKKEKRRVLSESTVCKMKKLLSFVVSKGNARSAKSAFFKICGKTGTAQSGIYDSGREICRTWFAGFFPAENPHYIVVVMNEDGVGGSVECTPLFKEIAEKIVLGD